MQMTDDAFETHMHGILVKRRAAMFRAFKQMEMWDRALAPYEMSGEDAPDLSPEEIPARAEQFKPRKKTAIQHEFMREFEKSEAVLSKTYCDAPDGSYAAAYYFHLLEMVEGRFSPWQI